jgi:hypothetical protein
VTLEGFPEEADRSAEFCVVRKDLCEELRELPPCKAMTQAKAQRMDRAWDVQRGVN